MSDDDKKSSLKRGRLEEEVEPADEDEIAEPPTKVAKKADDRNEPEEEANTAGDPPKEKGDGASDCGTEKSSEEASQTEVGDSPANESAKEEKFSDPNTDGTPGDAKIELKETDKTLAAAKEEEAKAPDAADAAGSTPVKSDDATQKTAESTPEVPSGLPGTPLDPSQAATITNPHSIVEERAELEKVLVGRVIGKGGEMIRDLQARSGCRVDVDQNVPEDAPRIITYRGSRQTVDFAKQLVATLCSEDGREAELPLGMATRKQLIVPATSIGKIIGRGGEMIRDLQTRSKCKIQVDHSGAGVSDPSTRLVIVTGTEDAVVKAEEMIMFLVANPTMDAATAIDMLVEDKARGGVWGSGPPYPNLPNQGRGMQGPAGYGYGDGAYGAPAAGIYQQPVVAYGGGYGAAGTEMEVFYTAKTYMGRIIGSRGVTINDLQKRSGCDIQINQDVPHGQDCEISIKGSRQGIEMVNTMLREIIEMGPNHPYAGGAVTLQSPYAAGMVGGYQQAGYGQVAAPMQTYGYQQPAAQPVSYGAAYAYGTPAYPAAPYGQPAVYGQAPSQPYGMSTYQQAPTTQQYAQPPMQAPPPAAVWRSATTPEGQTYYYNEKTGETQWEKPAGM